MNALMIGYAGVSTNEQDLTVQRQALERHRTPLDDATRELERPDVDRSP